MRKCLLASVAAAGLALSGCDSEDVENTPVDDVDEIVDADDEGYPVAGELSEDQQANMDSLDREAASREYDTNWSAMSDGAASAGANSGSGASSSNAGDAGAMDSSNSQSGSGEASNSAGSASTGSSSSVEALRPRSQMDFAFLDRNGDGKLSVAEYAIWAVRSNPREPKPNDNTRPYTSVDQINEAGETFFYFDADGDTYLSPQEFGAARASARTP